ncbi:MAG: PaaI family thioesterase [Chlamydiales bacterium]|nr:PaaI family thioesterase [Chlamydiales bacterium]
MSIWFKQVDIHEINERNHNTLVTHLNIICTEVGDEFLKGKMMIHPHHLQPNGIMNGGASCVFAESLASTAANYCVDQDKYVCVGVAITTNHIKAVYKGELTGIAQPVHLGKSTQVWQVKVLNENNQLISITQFTVSVIAKK